MWLIFCTESGPVVDVGVLTQSSTSLRVHWRPPTLSNGVVQLYLMKYRLTRSGDCPPLDPPGRWSRLVDVDGHRLQAVITDLRPYSRYQIKIWARTLAGRGQVANTFGMTDASGVSSSRCVYLSLYVCISAGTLCLGRRRPRAATATVCLYSMYSVTEGEDVNRSFAFHGPSVWNKLTSTLWGSS